MSVLRMVDRNGRGRWSMVMMSGGEVVFSCHGFVSRVYFVFGIFSFLWILVAGYGHYMIFFPVSVTF